MTNSYYIESYYNVGLGTLQVLLSETNSSYIFKAQEIAAFKRRLLRQTHLQVSAIYRFGPRFANYVFGFMYPYFIAVLSFFNSKKGGL